MNEGGDNMTSVVLKYGPGGLPEETTFVISTTWSKFGPQGTSPQDNYQVFQSRSTSHKNFVSGTSNIFTEYGWLKETIKNEIDIWEDDDLLENVYGVTKLTANETGTITEIVYGFSGPKGGNQLTFKNHQLDNLGQIKSTSVTGGKVTKTATATARLAWSSVTVSSETAITFLLSAVFSALSIITFSTIAQNSPPLAPDPPFPPFPAPRPSPLLPS